MLLFLHGFLGQKEDWNPLLEVLQLPAIALDLPGHGMAPFTEKIIETIHEQVPKAKAVIGYSAGGRIALELKHQFPSLYEKLLLISSHPGLKNEEEKKARWKIDKMWIEKLKRLPFSEFLTEWYGQPLFSTLKTHPRFATLFEKRQAQNPQTMAQFLNVFSLAKRDYFPHSPHTFFIYGSEDLKYRELYHTLSSPNFLKEIKGAGHAAHIEKPKECARIIRRILDDNDGK